jgi:hypothetical protein
MAMMGSCFCKLQPFQQRRRQGLRQLHGRDRIENSYFFQNAQAIIAMAASSVVLQGDIYVVDPLFFGIWASIDSLVFVAPWDDHPLTILRRKSERRRRGGRNSARSSWRSTAG